MDLAWKISINQLSMENPVRHGHNSLRKKQEKTKKHTHTHTLWKLGFYIQSHS